LVAEGLTNNEIAARLVVSPLTAKIYGLQTLSLAAN
jgi:DNA-binding NarL/FixJ family response regulator